MDFFDFSEFSGEVALLGGREVLFVSFTLMKELESLKKKIKSLVVTLVDNEISVHNPALVTFVVIKKNNVLFVSRTCIASSRKILLSHVSGY